MMVQYRWLLLDHQTPNMDLFSTPSPLRDTALFLTHYITTRPNGYT